MPPKPLGPPPKFGVSNANTDNNDAINVAPTTNSNANNSGNYQLPQPPSDGSLFLRGAQGTPPSKKVVRAHVLHPNTAASALEVVIAPAMAQSLAKDIAFDPRGCFVDAVTDTQALIPPAAAKQADFQRDTCFRLVRQGASASAAWPQGLSEIPLKALTRIDRNAWIKYFVDLGAIARGDASIALTEMKDATTIGNSSTNNNSANFRPGAVGSSRNNSGGPSLRNSSDRLDEYDYGEDEEEDEDDQDQEQQQQQQQLQQLQQQQQNSLRGGNNNNAVIANKSNNNNNLSNNTNRANNLPLSRFGVLPSGNINNTTQFNGAYERMMMNSSNSVPITQPKRPPPPHTLVIPQINIEDLTNGETTNFSNNSSSNNNNNNNTQIDLSNVSFTSSTAVMLATTKPDASPPTESTTEATKSQSNQLADQDQVAKQQQQQQKRSHNRPDPTSFWPKVTTASTPIYRSIRAPVNAQLWRDNHSYIYNYSDRPTLPPVDWSLNKNNSDGEAKNNNSNNDEYFYSSLLPSLDVVARRASLEALHTASNILFNNDPNSSAFTSATDYNDEEMMRLKQKQHSSQEQQQYRERQVFLQRQQKLAFGIPWNEDVETIKRALEQVQLSSVDIAYDLIRKARHSCDDPRRKPVKCIAVLCDINKFVANNNKDKNNNATAANAGALPSYIVQAGQAGLQITEDAVILRGPSFDFSCLKGEIKNVEGGGGSTVVGAGSDGSTHANCCSSSSLGAVLEQICLSEFPKWMPHSEYSFLLDEKGGDGESSNSSTLTELPSTVIVRVVKKQVNSQYQKFLTFEEELDLHLVLMFRWPVRADSAAKAFNDFWLQGAGTAGRDIHIMNNKPYQICPVPQKNSRVNQNGTSLFGFLETELYDNVLGQETKTTASNLNKNNGNIGAASSQLLRARQSEREPDFESMQKWTMLDFYATKKRQLF